MIAIIFLECIFAFSHMKITRLRVEYLENPIGLDSPTPRFFWQYELDDESKKEEMQIAYQIFVSTSLEDLQKNRGSCWDSGRIESDQSIQISYQGLDLQTHQKYYWKVITWDNSGNKHDSLKTYGVSFWQAGIMNRQDWHASWIGIEKESFITINVKNQVNGQIENILQSPPCPLLRKEFECEKPIAQALIYASALGEYELRLNGMRVGDRYLTPEWTDYAKRVFYQTFDVTAQIKEGTNAIGGVIGDGWYMGLLGPGDKIRQHHYGENRRLFCQLVLFYQDGSIEEINTDDSWKLYEDGPIRAADHFLGETIDFSKELKGWDLPNYSENGWKSVFIDKVCTVNLVAQKNEPVQFFKDITPIEIFQAKNKSYLVNMGQNMVGWVELHLNGKKGQKITIRHGEMLEKGNSLYTENLRIATQTDTYLLSEDKPYILHPHFTFHGFQYIEISGLSEPPTKDMIIGKAFSSNPPVTGTFECSNPMLNKLWQNILWTQRDNMHTIPTDCPQRNERMGWMGDAQVFAQTGIYNMDMAAFFNKFTVDMRDAQGEDGQFTDFSPHPFSSKIQFSFSPGWADCGIIVPWRLYVAYGDKKVLKEHYDAMQKFMDLIHDENPDYLWTTWGGNYGDWLHGDTLKKFGYPKKGGECPKDVYATLFYFQSAVMLAKIARILGKDDDAKTYFTLSENVRSAFKKAYLDSNGKIKGDTQSAYAMALGFGILTPENYTAAVSHLINALKKYKNRLSTGFISTIQMMLELSNHGYNDLAYQLIETDQFPSWGYSIKQGSTTIWERWDGYVKGRGFQSKGMNSFNHYSIGAVGEWMYSNLLGINFDESSPAMKHIIIRPRPGSTLTSANGSYHSIYGKISVEWIKKQAKTNLIINIPPNTTATVFLPSDPTKSIEIKSGKYAFEY
jgi:alpha-L-rhamnosidase